MCLSTVIRGVVGAYPACVVDDGEVCLVLELFGLLELGVGALLLHQLVHKRLVCGFGEFLKNVAAHVQTIAMK